MQCKRRATIGWAKEVAESIAKASEQGLCAWAFKADRVKDLVVLSLGDFIALVKNLVEEDEW